MPASSPDSSVPPPSSDAPPPARRAGPRRRMTAVGAIIIALLVVVALRPAVSGAQSGESPERYPWVRIPNGGATMYENISRRYYLGREESPRPSFDRQNVITNRPGPPSGMPPVGDPGYAALNGLDSRGARVACSSDWPSSTPPPGRPFSFWSSGYWTVWATWSRQTSGASTIWTKNEERSAFFPTGGGCAEGQMSWYAPPTPTPTRLPGNPTPTPLPPLPTNSLPPPTQVPGVPAACQSVPEPMRLTIQVTKPNGTTTEYEFNYVGYRTDYTLSEYWNAQGGRVTLNDIPPDPREDVTTRFPHPRTWVRLDAGDVVTVTFPIGTFHALDDYRGGAYYWDPDRAAVRLAIQEMGADQSPGGNGENADRLLMWLAINSNAWGRDERPPYGYPPAVPLTWKDLDLYQNTFAPPLGLQAVLAPEVTLVEPQNVFTNYDWTHAPYVNGNPNESLVSRKPWPDETYRYLRPLAGRNADGSIIGRNTPANMPPLKFRFTVEAGKMYRVFAMTVMQRPGCDGKIPTNGWKIGRPVGTFSQLAFGNPKERETDPLLDLAIDRLGAAEVAVGAQAEYWIKVTNSTENVANPITSTTTLLTETIPTGLEFVSARCDDCTTFTQQSGTRPDGAFVWNIGEIPPGASRTVRITVHALVTAPDQATMNAETMPAPPQEDQLPDNNRADWTMRIVRGNVRAEIAAPRLTRPGQEFEIRARARNTTPGMSAFIRSMTLTLPYGVTLVDAGGGHVDGSSVTWNYRGGDGLEVPGGAMQEYVVRVRMLREDEAAALPAHVTTGLQIIPVPGGDRDPSDNEARARTVVLITPRPQGDVRLYIHSEFDPNQGVYLTERASFAWPLGETLYFTPRVTLAEQQPGLPYYRVEQRIVAWSFRSGPWNLTQGGAPCRDREEPTAAETEHADLSGMPGCRYRYLDGTPSPDAMRRQGRLHWSAFAPTVEEATYLITPPPSNPRIGIQYAALVTLTEVGEDLDGDGRTDSVLERRTFVLNGGDATVTLIAPRDAR